MKYTGAHKNDFTTYGYTWYVSWNSGLVRGGATSQGRGFLKESVRRSYLEFGSHCDCIVASAITVQAPSLSANMV